MTIQNKAYDCRSRHNLSESTVTDVESVISGEGHSETTSNGELLDPVLKRVIEEWKYRYRNRDFSRYEQIFKTGGRLRAEEGVMCNRMTCDPNDDDCLKDKLFSVAWQFVALPTVKYLTESVELLKIETMSFMFLPNLKFYIISGNEDGLFEAVDNDNSASLNLVKPVIGPAQYNLTLKLENWNFLDNQLLSAYLTHVLIDVSKDEWN